MSSADYLDSLLADFADLDALLAERSAHPVPWHVEVSPSTETGGQ